MVYCDNTLDNLLAYRILLGLLDVNHVGFRDGLYGRSF